MARRAYYVSPPPSGGAPRPPTWSALTARLRGLAAANPGACRITTVGASRGGEPLLLLTLGHGPLRLLIVAGAHPNEPVGHATVVALAEHVLAHPSAREDATWYVLPSSDPDGALLNEAWYFRAWPPTLESYHRGFYRPAAEDQPEATFPATRGGPAALPETRALMTVVDTVRPDAMVSLHNADSGGSFYVTTRGETALVDLLADCAARHDLPVAHLPADCVDWASPGPGVFVLPPAATPRTAATDSTEGCSDRSAGSENGGITGVDEWQPAGATSVHYAARHGCLGLYPEVPMWRTEPIGLPTAEGVRHLLSTADFLTGVMERTAAAAGPTPFLPAVQDTVKGMRLVARLARRQPPQASDHDLHLLLPLRAAGMLLRHLDTQLDATTAPLPHLLSERLLLREHFDRWLRQTQAALRPQPLPLSRVVGFQLDTILGTARLLSPG
ncbi:M14 family zinc carboxypeptidase [Streptomyces longispororuber]|uniref:M14 family zinc carboxypeptidase n=1 Tax=Streptomyces longispororuber TaxID=68230 RepID=UPI0036FF96B6